MTAAILASGSTPTRRRRGIWGASLMVGAGVVLAGLTVSTSRPIVLVNTTPSEPAGVYVRTDLALAPGQIIAFKAPAAAFPYADDRLKYLHRVPMLKAIAAGAGDDVCTRSGRLRINGRDLAGIADKDSRGAALPHWSGCRQMAPGELFVFSDRVPNSFDSRYFGPISVQAVIGVYRRLSLRLGAH